MEILGRIFEEDFTSWFESRPDIIKKLILKCPPQALMVNKETNQLMFVLSYSEDGTIKCAVSAQYNNHLYNALPGDYAVFGLDPDDMKFHCWFDEDEKVSSWIGSKPQHKVC